MALCVLFNTKLVFAARWWLLRLLTWWRYACSPRPRAGLGSVVTGIEVPFTVWLSSWGKRGQGDCFEGGWLLPWEMYPAMESTSCLTKSPAGFWLKKANGQVSWRERLCSRPSFHAKRLLYYVVPEMLRSSPCILRYKLLYVTAIETTWSVCVSLTVQRPC